MSRPVDRGDGTGTVHLQYVGRAPSKPASEFQVGEAVMWNGGTSNTIVAVRRASPAYLTLTLRTGRGETYDRRVKASRSAWRRHP